uniref:VWFA domain-containing protein n=1 Tax=Esox lucius TaxID=8010 RepID=A0A3P8XW53_ESOLU
MSSHFDKPAAGFGYKVVQMNSTSDELIACLLFIGIKVDMKTFVHNRYDTSVLIFSLLTYFCFSQICGPTIPRECKTMTTYNGMCLEMYTNCNVFIGSSVHSSLKECPGQMDIAFLLDGSGSIITADFNQMKAFVKNLIREFLKGDVQFAIAQYSNNCKIHFDFNDFPFGSWENKINGIGQISGGTFTARAIKKVVKNVFSINGGSRPMAKKVLIVITDGNSHDSIGLDKAAYEAESKMIIRFAIGVGAVFSSKHGRGELETIASSPPSKHMFQVGSFQALDQIKDTLKSSIFSLEGSQTGDSIKMEMAQEGFSAAYKPGGFHVASVGAFQWRGAYQEYTSATETPTLKQSYSMAVARTRTRQFTILGAPRYKHTGRVECFELLVYFPYILQIGAYFGAEICAVDIDNDSYMDFVLISAPTFTDRQREGRVYVCTISDWSGVVCGFAAEMTLQGDVGKIGRFGTSLAQLPDLNVDGFNDLAVGAPLENNGKGSVYIFHGSRIGISNIYSQKISGFDVQSGLKFFGLSISQSSLDMSSDSLPDLAVGSKGAVLLLRSKPIATIRTLVSFHPPKISTDASRSNIALKHTATVCFTMTKNTADNTKAKINYTLTLDVTRQAPNYRAYYNNQDKMRKKTKTVTLSQGQQCFDHIFFIMEEPEDVLNELSNELDYTFEGLPSSGGLSLSLSPQTLTTTYHPLGFVTRCGTDNNCVDNLKVDFNFTGSSEMKVGIDDVLNVTVSVESREENSYNSRVILTYPAGLSFRRLITIQGKVECNSIDSEHGVTWGKSDCTINKPIFKSNSKYIKLSNGKVLLSVFIANSCLIPFSGNNEHAPASELYKVKRIGVKYRIYVLITRFDSTKYINFTAGKNVMQKHVNQSFVVVNYVRDFNLTVKIKVPMKLGDKYIWADPDVLKIPGCRREHDEKPIATDFVDKLKKKAAVDCSVAMCWVFVCSVVMRKDAHNTYNIAGNVSSGWIEQIGLESAHLSLISSATLEYDRNQYIYFSLDSHQNIPPIETEVEVYPEIDFTKEIIGGAVGGLFLLALITPGLYKIRQQYEDL